ncbi:MAG: thiamine diphosphokinase [Chloroflexota bacterium]
MTERGAVRGLVLADGERPTRRGLDEAWPGWDAAIDVVIAADGGAALASELGVHIDAWVGDGDSIDATLLDELRRSGTPVTLAPADKDESDTELALRAAVDRGATDITILGGLGGLRLDHALANVLLSTAAAFGDCAVRLIDDRTRVSLLRGPVRLQLDGRAGDTVSLLPLGARVDAVTTTGLRYALSNEALEPGPARGLSNVRVAATAVVEARSGLLLIVESPARLSP